MNTSVDQLKEDEISGIFCTCGGEENMQGFGDGKLKDKGHLDGLRAGGRIILKRILRVGWKRVNWNNLV
jgi:hypothetical protein